MSEARGRTKNWVEDWIEEQREQIRASQSTGETQAQNPDDLSKWLELGRQMWGSFEQFSSKRLFGIAPPLGWAREHEQAWRDFAAAQARYRQLEAQLQGQLAGVQIKALASLEDKTRERSAANRPIASVRELYDLWIECGEQEFAQLAHSEAYCRLQAELANAAVQLRSSQQALIERALKQLDLPTRAELNSVHKQLRELRERLARVGESAPARGKTSSRAAQAEKRGTARNKAKRKT